MDSILQEGRFYLMNTNCYHLSKALSDSFSGFLAACSAWLCWSGLTH